jgi:hypothetical protein
MKTKIHFSSYFAQLFLEWETLQTNLLDKIKTHILCLITCFTESLAIYEIMWKSIVDPNRHRMTISGKIIAYKIPKTTDTHPEYIKLIAFQCNNGCMNTPQCHIICIFPSCKHVK